MLFFRESYIISLLKKGREGNRKARFLQEFRELSVAYAAINARVFFFSKRYQPVFKSQFQDVWPEVFLRQFPGGDENFPARLEDAKALAEQGFLGFFVEQMMKRRNRRNDFKIIITKRQFFGKILPKKMIFGMIFTGNI